MKERVKTFLIGPVRGYEPSAWEALVESLEAVGYDVYWPAKHTPQDDPTGVAICAANCEAIRDSRVVHVVWDGKSEGVLFDLGMAFALEKPVVVVDLPPPTDGKSFQNMVRAWAGGMR